jgi:lipoprotein-anchoring transpeptidase ErfK/SrfK
LKRILCPALGLIYQGNQLMKLQSQLIFTASIIIFTLFLSGCDPNLNQPVSNVHTNETANNNSTPITTQATPTPQPQPKNDEAQAANLPVTMPLLDAMFTGETFKGELKSKLNLTDDQIAKLQQAAHEATMSLEESENESGSTSAANQRALEKIQGIIGVEKSKEFAAFVRQRWSNGETADSNRSLNSVPKDTRIIVNAPAFRMDVFKDGQLLRTYKIGIGYPEFPLPVGLRQAKEIIFNPTWTPPDEPWVKDSKNVKAGQKVEAGSKLNPLGPIKIPIGLPSLIHGGKNVNRLGQFASHGCVGLTSPQVQDFSLILAQISGTELSNTDVTNYEKNKTETKNVNLNQTIPVELRYETIVVEDGKLKVYRDVYERGTNTEENLRKVLEVYGMSLDSLSEAERTAALNAVSQMAIDAQGNPVSSENANSNSNSGKTNTNSNKNANSQENGKVTKNIKGKKEIIVEIAALKGKGYPAPVDLNTGGKSNPNGKITGKP